MKIALGHPTQKKRILQKRSLSNQMNTPIRIKNFLLLQRFANQHHRNPQKTEFILVRQSEKRGSSSFLLFPLLLPLLPPQKEEEEVYMGTQKIQKFQKFGQIPKWESRESLPVAKAQFLRQ